MITNPGAVNTSSSDWFTQNSPATSPAEATQMDLNTMRPGESYLDFFNRKRAADGQPPVTQEWLTWAQTSGNGPYHNSGVTGKGTAPNLPEPAVPGMAPISQGGSQQSPYAPNSSVPNQPPTLNPSDPASRQAFIAYYANQPGANPSLKNDPGYWDGKIASGELGADQNYIVGKFMTPEGAPAGQSGSISNLYNPTDLTAGWTTPFNAPTAEQAMNSPGVQFGLTEGANAIQRGAAAKGNLLTGGTLKDLNSWAQDYASQQYGNVYNRALGEYGMNQNTFFTNQNNLFNRNLSLAQLGQNSANNLGSYGSNYMNAGNNLYTGAGNAAAAGTVGSANAYAPLYGTAATAFNDWWNAHNTPAVPVQ